MKYEKIEEISIPSNATVSVKEMGNIIEITYNSNYNSKPQTIKLSSKEYLVIRTGEVKEYERKAKNRSQSIESMQKTMNKIKELVQTNITDAKKVRWCTLTYANNMKDAKQLYNDFRKFNQRFQRYLKNRSVSKAEYICVIEPQERGAWHCHVLYIFKENAPYISNKCFSQIWGKGFTKITKIENVTNVAIYLMAYLSDWEIPLETKDMYIEKDVKEVVVKGEKKAFIKGRRLILYPSGINIVRHSRGVKYPEVKRMNVQEAEKLIANKIKTYQTSFKLSNECGYTTTIIKNEYRKI